MQLNTILESCLCVDDLEAALSFYRDKLGLEVVTYHPPRHLFLRCGRQMLLLFRSEESLLPGEIPPHGTTGSGHLAFGVREEELDAWRELLVSKGIPIEKIIDWPGGARSVYFRDPSGNSLEFAMPKLWGLE